MAVVELCTFSPIVNLSKKKLSGGAWGSIHEACCLGSSDCGYIGKWVDVSSEKDIQKYESEVKLQILASKHGATLPIIFAWIDEESKKGWFIMKRLHMDIRQYIKYNHLKKLPDRIAQKIIEIFRIFRDLRIVHWDSHLGNFMLSSDENVFAIDFGQSKKYSETSWKKNLGRSIYDLSMFINDLKSNKIEINSILIDEYKINASDIPLMSSDDLKRWG